MPDQIEPVEIPEFYQTPTFLDKHPVLQQAWGDSMSEIRIHYVGAFAYGFVAFFASIWFGLSTASKANIIYCTLVTFGLPLAFIFVKNFIYAPAKVRKRLVNKISEQEIEKYQLKTEVRRLLTKPEIKLESVAEKPIIEKSKESNQLTGFPLAFDNKLKEIGKIFSGEKQEEIPEKETSQQKREEKPQEIEEPTFTEGFDVVQFTFGSNSLMYNIADLERTKQKFIVADNPLFLYVEDGKPYVDVDIYNVPFQPTVRLQRNKIMNRPANWDMNSDKTALEIVDEERKPVFQLYYKKPSHIVINGFFNINGIIVLASEKETVMNLLEVPTNTLEPIFRYPALEHRGERC